MNYWITVSVPALDDDEAQAIAEGMAASFVGRVVQVDAEPPQGSMIVGDMHEDALADDAR